MSVYMNINYTNFISLLALRVVVLEDIALPSMLHKSGYCTTQLATLFVQPQTVVCRERVVERE